MLRSAGHFLLVCLLTACLPGQAAAAALRVGLYQNPPKIYSDSAGKPAGIFVELLQAVAKAEGWRLDFVPGEWNELLDGLEAGRLDLMPDVAHTAQRARRFSFPAVPAAESWSQAYAHPSADVSGLADLDGRRVAVLEGASQNRVFASMMKGFGYRVQLLEAPSFEQAFALVAQRKADLAISNHFFGEHAFRRHGLAKTPIVFAPAQLYIVAGKGRQAGVLAALDRRLAAWKADPDSPYYPILARWADRPPTSAMPAYVRWVLIGLGLTLAAAAALILWMRRQAQLRTRRLHQSEAERAFGQAVISAQQESSQDGILVVDGAGGIVSHNRRFVELWGLSEELLGRRSEAEVTDWARSQVVDAAAFDGPLKVFKADPAARGQDDLALKDGRRLERYSAPLLDAEGRCQGRVWYFRDVTALMREAARRQKLEEQLRAAQRMEAVGSLAGGVAHDFNNLLGVILGYATLARDRLEPQHPVRQDLEPVLDAAERGAALTRQLLSFSRQQPLQTQVLDLGQVLGGMEGLLRRLLGAGIDLRVKVEPGLGHVRADRSQLEQVVMNLVVNARDAMPQGGRLTIEAANADLDEAYVRGHAGVQPGRYVVLAVSDSGAGMDEATRARIFEPFFTTKAPGKGTGLGLATVYGVAKQSGGHVWVYSELGQGTVFRVYLPLVEAELSAAAAPAPAPAAPVGAGRRALLVEDEPALRSLFSRQLEGLGFQVSAAEDGAQALALARGGPSPDLLLTDMVMPGLGGQALAAELRREFPALKVLYMSGYTEALLDDGAGLEPGASFLQKPFGLAGLSASLRGLGLG
jgi:signal transduction histidine kinase